MFRPTRLHQYYHSLAELPSCVTPSLDYYEIRSHAPQCQLHPKTSPARFGWLVSNASSWAHMLGYGNINPLSIDYACRPRLRSRLTLGGLAWPRNPWSSGGGVSHSPLATHACILTRVASTAGSPRRGHRDWPPPPLRPPHDAPLPIHTPGHRLKVCGGLTCECHGFGGVLEPRYIVGAESLDQ